MIDQPMIPATEDPREARLEALRDQVVVGAYVVDERAVAAAMLTRMLAERPPSS